MLVGIASMNIADITTQLLDILLAIKRSHRSLTISFGHLQRIRLSTHRLVAVALRVEIRIFYGWNLVGSLMTGYSQEVIDDATLQAIDSQLGFVRHLGIIAVKVFRHLDNRLLEQLHVTNTTDNHSQIDRIVGFDFGLV